MAKKYDVIMANLGGNLQVEPMLPEQMEDLEKRLGYRLPADYRQFLLDDSNYQHPGMDLVFPYIRDGYETMGSLFTFYNAKPAASLADIADYYWGALENPHQDEIDYYLGMSLIRSMDGVEEIGWPTELLPIGSDAGGNQICLALYGLRPGAIFYWKNCPGYGTQGVYFIADSFDEFLRLLQVGE